MVENASLGEGPTESGVKTEEEKKFLLKDKVEKTFELPCGKNCHMIKPKGKHSIQAGELAIDMYGKNPSGMQVMNIMMSLVTKIDGEKMRPDELEELWSEDYSKIQEVYMELSGGF